MDKDEGVKEDDDDNEDKEAEREGGAVCSASGTEEGLPDKTPAGGEARERGGGSALHVVEFKLEAGGVSTRARRSRLGSEEAKREMKSDMYK